MYKYILVLCMVCFAAITSYADNSVYSQLGIKGVTVTAGNPVYASYLVKLNSNGVFDASVFPSSGVALAGTNLTHIVYIDSVTGLDSTTRTGTAIAPYKTLAYAATNAVTNTLFIFAPGTYSGCNIVNSNLTRFGLMGLDADQTYIDSQLSLSADVNVEVYVRNIRIKEIKQQDYRHLTAYLRDQAWIEDGLTRQYPTAVNSVLTVYRDPSVTAAYPSASTNYTDYLLFEGGRIDYKPSTTNNWWSGIPNTVATGLDLLAARIPVGTTNNAYLVWNGTNWISQYVPGLPTATTNGDMIYWNGTNWMLLAGVTNTAYVLYGGAIPEFKALPGGYTNTIAPGTNPGDMLYWSGVSWIASNAPTASGISNTLAISSDAGGQSISNLNTLAQATNAWHYWGNELTDGSWRQGPLSATEFAVQVRVGGIWTNAVKFTAP